MTYRIKSVAVMTGIRAATLRAWERRYGIVSPDRTGGGYRAYTEEDVERLRRIKELTDAGYKVSEAIALAQREGGAGVAEELPAPDELRDQLLDAVLALDRARAAALMDGVGRLPFGEQMTHFETVVFPVLHEIGSRWARGEASVVQEHFASAFARERLAAVLDGLNAGPARAREAVCFGAPGERHELGLLAAAVHLALRGWRVVYLGPDLPLESLRPTLHARRPALVCTSLLRSMSEERCLAFAAELRQIAPAETGVLVGGPGVPASLVGTPLQGVQLTRNFPERLEVAA